MKGAFGQIQIQSRIGRALGKDDDDASSYFTRMPFSHVDFFHSVLIHQVCSWASASLSWLATPHLSKNPWQE
jgi:hypothetical protein